MLGLTADRIRPGQAQPGQILQDCRHERRPAAADVDILDSQQHLPAVCAREFCVPQCRGRMPQMQPTGGRGGESGYNGHGCPESQREQMPKKRQIAKNVTLDDSICRSVIIPTHEL